MEASRVVLVTGGTSGIGLATVKRFLDSGHRVYTCSRSEVDLDACFAGSSLDNLDHRVVDVGDPSDLTYWIESIGNSEGYFDVLFNNAAFVAKKPIDEFDLREFRASLDVNLLAILESTKAALPFFLRSECGVLINMSSMAAVDPFPGFSVYGGCKAFIEVFTRAIANEWSENNIACFSIRAGAVETPLLRAVLPDFPEQDAIHPNEVASVVFNLALSPEKYESGAAIEVTSRTIE